MEHRLQVTNRRIRHDHNDRVVQYNVNTDTVSVTFDAEWTGLRRYLAIFVNGTSGERRSVASTSKPSTVTIPWETLQTEGFLFVSFVGYKNDTDRIVTEQMDKPFIIAEGGCVDASSSQDPTPSEIDEALKQLKAAIKEAEAATQSVTAAVDKANSAASDASAKASEASTAAGEANDAAASASTQATAASKAATEAASAASVANEAAESVASKMAELDEAEQARETAESTRETWYTETKAAVDDGALNGATFTPAVDGDGNLSWSNDKELPNPETVNIKGPQGDQGEGLTLLDSYESLEALEAAHPDNNQIGDAYMGGTHYYTWSGSEWADCGELQGAPGPAGGYYEPTVSEEGVLSLVAHDAPEIPTTWNIKGPKGEPGPPGETIEFDELTDADIDAAFEVA